MVQAAQPAASVKVLLITEHNSEGMQGRASDTACVTVLTTIAGQRCARKHVVAGKLPHTSTQLDDACKQETCPQHSFHSICCVAQPFYVAWK